MFEIVLTSADRALLEALNALGVRYLRVGMGAALIEGAPGTTQDIDLWFDRIDEGQLREAAHRAGGLYTSGFGSQPPAVGGEGLDRVIVSKRAAQRAKDSAQLPMLEAALAARRARAGDE